MKAFTKLSSKLQNRKDAGLKQDLSQEHRLNEQDIYRYRRQRGVNLGSSFVLEKWISGSPFQNAIGEATSDCDVAYGPGAREILEKHWDTWITEDDWKWMAEMGINSVRLPIGYYHLYGKDPGVVKGTPFSKVGHVFEGAWSRIVQAVNTASKYDIGVLIDLHSAPGKQNSDAHSGINGPLDFYKHSNLSHTLEVLKILATAFAQTANIVGLQLVNEPHNHPALPDWYTNTLNTIRSTVGPDLPLYIHDAWNTAQFAALIRDRPDFVVLDHHLYRCFTSQDQQLSGDQHATALPLNEFENYSKDTRGNLVVAEFSAALNPKSLNTSNAGEQDRQRRVFARAEIDLFERTCGGWWMWTYKKDQWDAGWSLRDAVRAEIMPSWVGIRRGQGCTNDASRRDAACTHALNEHAGYWSQFPGNYEHWRFELGFKQGWDDAFLFFEFNSGILAGKTISELGFIGQWAKRRALEHVADRGGGSGVWEYEHGFRQGVENAKMFFLKS